MAEYDFSALTDKEFEELVRDLLSKDPGISLRTFKKGKDKGIDIRYSSPNNINKVIVQAKHNTFVFSFLFWTEIQRTTTYLQDI